MRPAGSALCTARQSRARRARVDSAPPDLSRELAPHAAPQRARPQECLLPMPQERQQSKVGDVGGTARSRGGGERAGRHEQFAVQPPPAACPRPSPLVKQPGCRGAGGRGAPSVSSPALARARAMVQARARGACVRATPRMTRLPTPRRRLSLESLQFSRARPGERRGDTGEEKRRTCVCVRHMARSG